MIAATAFSVSTGIASVESVDPFYRVDRFADLEVLRYKVPGFEKLTLQQKKLLYYLSQAAIEGRDIIYDQNCKWNLAIRRTLEAVYTQYKGDRSSDDFEALETYLKQVWFANGIHHHYSTDKFVPGFGQEFFEKAVKSVDTRYLPLQKGETVNQLLANISPVIFYNFH